MSAMKPSMEAVRALHVQAENFRRNEKETQSGATSTRPIVTAPESMNSSCQQAMYADSPARLCPADHCAARPENGLIVVVHQPAQRFEVCPSPIQESETGVSTRHKGQRTFGVDRCVVLVHNLRRVVRAGSRAALERERAEHLPRWRRSVACVWVPEGFTCQS